MMTSRDLSNYVSGKDLEVLDINENGILVGDLLYNIESASLYVALSVCTRSVYSTVLACKCYPKDGDILHPHKIKYLALKNIRREFSPPRGLKLDSYEYGVSLLPFMNEVGY